MVLARQNGLVEQCPGPGGWGVQERGVADGEGGASGMVSVTERGLEAMVWQEVVLSVGKWQANPRELASEMSVSALFPLSCKHCVNCEGEESVMVGL